MPALAIVTDGMAWVAVSDRLAKFPGRQAEELLGLEWHPDDRSACVIAARNLLTAPEGEHENLMPRGMVRLLWRWAKEVEWLWPKSGRGHSARSPSSTSSSPLRSIT